MIGAPSYDSRGLVNLVAEIESRLIGSSPSPPLAPEIGALIPEGETVVMVMFDGLGVAQLTHESAGPLLTSHQATLHAPFPTTTSVSLATVATGLPPSRHGLMAHLIWLEEAGRVVNTLKWVDLSGRPVAHEYGSFLPGPNLWERLRQAGVEPITVQPTSFAGSPLSRVLYRGARFERAWDDHDLVEATVQLASEPNRFIFTYFWPVDFAGHVYGLQSEQLADSLRLAVDLWEGIVSRLPPGVTVLGTADHGLIDYDEKDKVLIRQKPFDGLRYGGDPRGLQVWAEETRLEELADLTGGELTDPLALLGPDPCPETKSRIGDALLLAPPGKVLLPPGFDKRLHSYHGGLADAELEIPLLVG
ncbi:MAG: alkaline phosphatase family protein [Acidimicrobiia bacterium]